MGKRRAPCCDNSEELKRGPWSDEESKRLKAFILKSGHHNWRSLPKLAGNFLVVNGNLNCFVPSKDPL